MWSSFWLFTFQLLNDMLIKDPSYCFIALFDNFISVNIKISFAGNNLFSINTQTTLFNHIWLWFSSY